MVAPWAEVVQKYFGERELLVIVGEVAKRVGGTKTPEGAESADLPDACLLHLERMLTSLIRQSHLYGTGILTSPHLLTFLDAFKGSRRVALCRDVLESFAGGKSATAAAGGVAESKGDEGAAEDQLSSANTTSDPVLINTLFDLARCIHDSISPLTAYQELTTTVNLINNFIDKVLLLYAVRLQKCLRSSHVGRASQL